MIGRPDIDAVVVATPDHWHAKIALEAMDHGKDVYLEKPMCHTIEEAKQLAVTVHETKRVLQVGSQTTSAEQWWKAKKAIADGMIGQMLMSQGSYHRNSVEGEWNWTIDPDAGPDGKGENYIDWKMWLGSAPKRAFDADRFFRFRKYWDYSGGIATDLFFHVVAPLNICWPEPQFPLPRDGVGRHLRVQGWARSARHVQSDGGLREKALAGAEFLDGELPAHSGPDPRPRRHHHHGGPRQVRRRDRSHHGDAREARHQRRVQSQVGRSATSPFR